MKRTSNLKLDVHRVSKRTVAYNISTIEAQVMKLIFNRLDTGIMASTENHSIRRSLFVETRSPHVQKDPGSLT